MERKRRKEQIHTHMQLSNNNNKGIMMAKKKLKKERRRVEEKKKKLVRPVNGVPLCYEYDGLHFITCVYHVYIYMVYL